MKAGSAKGKLVVISGPSGVGKSTVVRRVRQRVDAAYSVSATTRPPRAGERDGVDYRFVSRDEFDRMVSDGELLEWAEVFGNCYGTPAAPVRQAIDAAQTVILEIDVQGAMQVSRRASDALFVMMVPPSDEVLEQRLRGRSSDDEQAVQRRLGEARREIAIARESGIYDYFVVNDDLDRAVDEVATIIQQE